MRHKEKSNGDFGGDLISEMHAIWCFYTLVRHKQTQLNMKDEMNKPIIILILLLSFYIAKAEGWTYTVIASNGLSIRESPNIDSDKITIVPFGELVQSSNHGVSDKLDTIGGTIGFWMKIKYKDISGFMFSGFLVSEDVFPLSRADTIPYVIIDEWVEYSEAGKYSPGFYNPSYYIPNMYWYGIKVMDTTTMITKTNVIPEYNPNRWNKTDTIFFDVKLKVDNQEDFDFVFGTKHEIESGEIKSNKYYGLNSKIGLFIYPEQFVRIHPFNAGYQLNGSETITLLKNAENNIKRKYTLDLLHYGDTILVKNINNVFDLNRPARMHAGFKNPQLFWSGDINNDRNPDLILKYRMMHESAGESGLYCIISQVENGKIEYYAITTRIDDQKIK